MGRHNSPQTSLPIEEACAWLEGIPPLCFPKRDFFKVPFLCYFQRPLQNLDEEDGRWINASNLRFPDEKALLEPKKNPASCQDSGPVRRMGYSRLLTRTCDLEYLA